ncbi:flavin reductase family protein [Amycolatopsis mongoliensis]|uniref:Flavin reductase family protein n=1 Tax=Amycolatopsis mongoliensis TaxID=715475 RepID=A0A9Y2JYR3_9PSEU|nr:flavin reductase family protein [Amycolatopsis sp. 4-36]WIY05757.1 flavin reductase family protein [Amycolatopsis sp. 4-36]
MAGSAAGRIAVDLRGVMRTFATGVCVATTYVDRPGGRRHDGVTINSLSSVSLVPPLVSICLRLESVFLADVLETGRWAVSILPEGAREIARLLAKDRRQRADALGTLPLSPGPATGALVVDGAGVLECELWNSFDLGDHRLVVGEVVGTDDRRDGPPLLFAHGGYQRLADPGPVPLQDRVSDEWW